MKIALVTCSFRDDLELCRLLCRSVDQFAPSDFVHCLYVPERDLPLFADLVSPQRRVEAQESLLPKWFWRAPLPSGKWRKRLLLPRRDMFLTPFHGLVRGWIAQQIVKIAASLDSPCDVVVHLDSDTALIQPLRPAHFVKQGLTSFYASPVEKRLRAQALWYDAAIGLLGIPLDDYYRADYVAPMVTWRRPVVAAMTARIEATTGRAWQSALAAAPHLSECVLYGLYAERVVGLELTGLRRELQSPCLTRWSENFKGAADVERFLAGVEAGHLICCLQSTIDIPVATRAEIFNQAAATVARLQARPSAAA